jgi:hypothetical protein
MPRSRGRWSDEEVKTVEGKLKTWVKADRVARARLEERIKHAIWRARPPGWEDL